MKSAMIIFAFLAAVIGSGSAQVTRREAASLAADFILRSRSADTMSWRPKEAAGALLAVAANRPGEWRYHANQTTEVIATKNGVRMSLLQLISSKDGYGGVDHSQLSQFLGAIKLLCDNPRSFVGGHDLLTEAERRANTGLSPLSPANAGLALTLCTAGVRVPDSLLAKLLMPSRNATRTCKDVCFERAALSVLALSCVFREKDFDYDRKYVEVLLKTNLLRMTSDAAEPGFLHAPANIFRLALLLQVLEDSPFVLAVDEAAVLRRLISLQRPNGSFGDSVGVTAVVVPALARGSSQDIKNIRCFKEEEGRRAPEGMVVIKYQISEDFFKSQAFVGEMVAPEGATLLVAFQRYEQQYPEVLHIKVTENSFGTYISEVNDVKNRRRLAWRVVGGKEEDISKIRVRHGETYRISYRRV